jgi:hypothetical protein
MHEKYQSYGTSSNLRPASEIAAERREQIAAHQAEMQAHKDRDLARQTAVDSTPAMRIALWERRHGLALPRDPRHPLMQCVADGTQLDLDQVREEQKSRARRRAAPAAH